MEKNIFENVVKEEFHFLQRKYGFSSPVTEDYGREIFIKFERNAQTISISLEYGTSPLIEIFYPSSETGDKPTPWASKDGVERSRRFPKLKINTKYSDENENSVKGYIKEMSCVFEEKEAEWLKA